MKNEYILEFWYEGEVIDCKESKSALIIPRKGEVIGIVSWENPNNSRGRTWWTVKEIKHGIWKDKESTVLTQKIMIEVEPDPKNGLYESDPLYESFDYDKHFSTNKP